MSATLLEMRPHVDHELTELLRVGRLIQSGRYAGGPVDAPLREAFAAHFRKLCEFFGVQRVGRRFPDVKATSYVPGYPAPTDRRLQTRMYHADKLHAHLGEGRKALEVLRREWGAKADTALFVGKVRRFVGSAKRAGHRFTAAERELRHWP
ncbi:MAG TPA: hypothetical protein VEK77_13070 [Gemmatimonadales bacterium]|nr:hypothetical protein [Gemmatimonadales bacterium]